MIKLASTTTRQKVVPSVRMSKLLWGDTGGTAGSIFSLVAEEHFATVLSKTDSAERLEVRKEYCIPLVLD